MRSIEPGISRFLVWSFHPEMTKGGLLRFARNDEKNFMTPRSRGARRPSCAKTVSPLLDQRAQGMPGAQRTRSLACEIKKHTSIVTTVTPERPGIPRAMVLRLTSRSPRRPGFVATVVARIKVLPDARLGRLASANLAPTLGRQNHTTPPSAPAPFPPPPAP